MVDNLTGSSICDEIIEVLDFVLDSFTVHEVVYRAREFSCTQYKPKLLLL